MHFWYQVGKRLTAAIKTQCRWWFRGEKFTNESALLVHEYFLKKRMAKLGYQFNSSELTQFDANVYSLIDSTIADLKEKDLKRKRKK